jgi:hypothetical protein
VLDAKREQKGFAILLGPLEVRNQTSAFGFRQVGDAQLFLRRADGAADT